ncbi:Putative transcription factor bHLH041 [Zea mays]|uniref:Putative transcription factor bHLH041 n=1 Tax=Zea mays TaxID=4577 RepID=A0A1D6MHH8_MAIZE|nr:Putative transcription factor bHLH041 [Zea mays]
MDMDSSSSWLHGYATTNGFMCGGYAASPAEISMRMNMDDEAAAAVDMHDLLEDLDDPRRAGAGACSFPSSSSSSSLSLSLPASASLSCSPESSSPPHILGAATAPASGGCNQQYPEVSSHVPLVPPPPTVLASYSNLHAPAAAPEETSPAARPTGGAFKHYARHLGPTRTTPTKPGTCGQRMFKTAMSVLSKMHVAARYSQQQYYYEAAAAEVAPPPSVNQLQHMFSERKRREKLNDSFHALKAVLPPGAKKDKTSILIRAREYVRSLEARVAELEEKNKSLESRLAKDGSGCGDDHDSGSTTKVQVEISRAAANEELCTLKIAVIRSPSPCNMTDVVVRTLQCLKEQIGDGVSLVAMSTSGGGGGGAGPTTTTTGGKKGSPGDVLTLQIKSPGGTDWEEEPVKDAVAKVVADALTTTPRPPPAAAAAATTVSSCFGEASQLTTSS